MPLKFDLPGQEIILNDGNLNIELRNPNPKIAIIGTGTKGPVGLKNLSSTQNAVSLYGSGSEIARKVSEAFAGFGPEANVFAFRLGGKSLIFEYTDSSLLPAGLESVSMSSGTTCILPGAGWHTGSPSGFVAKEFHGATNAFGPDAGLGNSWVGNIALPDDESDDDKIFIYRIVSTIPIPTSTIPTVTPGEPTPPPIDMDIINGAKFAGDVNGYLLDDIMSFGIPSINPDVDDLLGNHSGAVPSNAGFIGDLGTLDGVEVTNIVRDLAGRVISFDFTDSYVTEPTEYVAIVVLYNYATGLTMSDGFALEAMEDTSGEFAVWTYTGSGPYNTFYGFVQPVVETFEGFKVETEDATSGLEDRIAVLFDPVTGLIKIYDTSVDSLLWSNESGNQIDLNVVTVTIDGDLTSLNPIDEVTYLEMVGLSDPDPATVPAGPAGIVAVSVSDILSLPNYYASMHILQASDSEATISNRRRYEELDDAYDSLLYFSMDIIVPVAAYVDCKNVAYLNNTVNDYMHDPNSSANVLTWLKTIDDGLSKLHYWSNDDISAGWTSATDRLNDDFHEVNFAYQLARFCQTSTANGRICQGVISVIEPKSDKTKDLQKWLGKKPVFSENGTMISGGTGLLGNPYTVGLPAEDLHTLTRDRDAVLGSVNGERTPGLFLTDSAEYDGLLVTDKNGFPVDMGKFVSQTIDWPVFSATGQRFGLQDSIDAYFAGFMVGLDPKVSPTSKTVRKLQSVWQPGLKIEEDLVKARYVFLSNREQGTVFVDSITMATNISDWQNSLTTRIVKAVTDALAAHGQKIEGNALSLPERIAFNQGIEEILVRFKKGNYLNDFSFKAIQKKVAGKLGDIKVTLALDVPREVKQVAWDLDLTI